MAHVMMTVELDPDAATLGAAAGRMGVDPAALDADFGVVPIDPDQNLYTVMVEEDAGARGGGPYSNPRIEPFGPS
jgi:hypothetical protein